MSENYQNWVERVVGGRDAKPLNSGDVVKSSAGEQFGVIEFVKIQKEKFLAEVGKKGDFYIYHFYPIEKLQNALIHDFYNPMSDALVQCFKNGDQIEASWEEDMRAFAVRVRGWTTNIWGDEMALRVIDILDEKLKES